MKSTDTVNAENNSNKNISNDTSITLNTKIHGEIIQVMKAMGCKSDSGGICQGLSFMGMQAYLSGESEMEAFNHRLKNISTLAEAGGLQAIKKRVENKLQDLRLKSITNEMNNINESNAEEKLKELKHTLFRSIYTTFRDEVLASKESEPAKLYVKKILGKFYDEIIDNPDTQLSSLNQHEKNVWEQGLTRELLLSLENMEREFDDLHYDDLAIQQQYFLKMATKHSNDCFKYKYLSDTEKSAWDIIKDVEIFSQGIDLYFNPAVFVEKDLKGGLFKEGEKIKEQDSDAVIHLLNPVTLDEKRNQEVSDASSMHLMTDHKKRCEKCRYFKNDNDLEKYLQSVMSELQREKVNQRIAFTLVSGDHAICLGFDPAENKYTLINADDLPAKVITDTRELAKLIAVAFGPVDFKTRKSIPASPIILNFKAYGATTDPKIMAKVTKAFYQYNDVLSVDAIKDSDKRNGHSLLALAVKFNQIDLVKEILRQPNTDPNLPPSVERNEVNLPLHIAILDDNHEMVKLLLDAGADPNLHHPATGCSPLSLAVMQHNPQMVNLLLGKKADPDLFHPLERDAGVTMPLHIAITTGNYDMAELLLKNKANPNILHSNGMSSLGMAMNLENPKFVKLLLAHGADPNIGKNIDELPISIAVTQKNVEMLELLFKNNARVNVKDFPAIMFQTLQTNDVSIMDCLLRHGADPDTRDKIGNSILRIAIQSEHPEMVKKLLEYGADPYARDKYGKSAYDVAHGEIKQLLIEHDFNHDFENEEPNDAFESIHQENPEQNIDTWDTEDNTDHLAEDIDFDTDDMAEPHHIADENKVTATEDPVKNNLTALRKNIELMKNIESLVDAMQKGNLHAHVSFINDSISGKLDHRYSGMNDRFFNMQKATARVQGVDIEKPLMLLEGVFKKNAAGHYNKKPDVFITDVRKTVEDLLSCIQLANEKTKENIAIPHSQHK